VDHLYDREVHVLSDPQSIVYAAVTKSLPAISRGADNSSYQLNDSGTVYNLTVSHQFAKRNRCVVRLRRDAYVSDPLIPANSQLASMTATLTVDYPTTGLTVSDAAALGKALTDYLGTTGLLTRISGGET